MYRLCSNTKCRTMQPIIAIRAVRSQWITNDRLDMSIDAPQMIIVKSGFFSLSMLLLTAPCMIHALGLVT